MLTVTFQGNPVVQLHNVQSGDLQLCFVMADRGIQSTSSKTGMLIIQIRLANPAAGSAIMYCLIPYAWPQLGSCYMCRRVQAGTMASCMKFGV